MAAQTCLWLQARKVVSFFLNNAAKTCLYELKMSGNIETEHVF